MQRHPQQSVWKDFSALHVQFSCFKTALARLAWSHVIASACTYLAAHIQCMNEGRGNLTWNQNVLRY